MKKLSLWSIGPVVGLSLGGWFLFSLFASDAYACRSGLSRLDPTCPGRILNPGGGGSQGPTQSSVGNGSARLNRTQSFQFYNQSGQTVEYLYLSPSQRSDWGRDILGSSVLYNGSAWNGSIRPNLDGCRYDIRAVLEDGRESTAYNVDACSTGGINIR